MNNTPTPRSKIILDHIKIYVEADNAAQSYAHYKEVNREIESMERELTAVTEQLAEMTLRWELTNDSLFDKRALADRLAEALLELRNNESMSLGGAAYEIIEQALQPLNHPKP